MKKNTRLSFAGMVMLGIALVALINWRNVEAQQTGPRPLIVSDIASIDGLSSSNPLANYPAGNPAYAGQEVAYDNEGIGIFIAPATQSTPITTDINVPECGHLGIQEWKGASYAYKLFSNPTGPFANQWQKRKPNCGGLVVIGSSGQIRAQTLTIKGTSVEGTPFTLQVNVPDHTTWDREVGGGSRRLYVDDTGATYSCYGPNFTRTWPNECEYSPSQAFALPAAGASPSAGPVAGNGLCQAWETPQSAPNDCPATYSLSLTKLTDVASVQLQAAAATGSIKIKIQNTSNVDAEFPVYCDSGFGSFTGFMKALTPDQTLNSTATSLPSGNIVLAPNASRELEYTFTIPASNSIGAWTAKCHTYPMNIQTRAVFTDKKQEITSAYSVTGLPPPPPPPPPPSSLDPTLLGWWKFDGNLNNEVAGGAAAVKVGNPVLYPSGGKLGGYVNVATSSDFLKIPYSSIFDLPTQFTVEFWFRQRFDRSFFQDLVYKGTPTNNYNFRIFRQLWNQYNFGPVITGYTATGTGYWTQTSNQNQLTHGEWHHVVFTKSTSERAYYLDGAKIHSATDSPSAKTPPSDIIIGDSAVDTDFDNLKIYNRGLSQSEVQQNGGFPATPPPPPPPPPSPLQGGAPLTYTDLTDQSAISFWCQSSANPFYSRVLKKAYCPKEAPNYTSHAGAEMKAVLDKLNREYPTGQWQLCNPWALSAGWRCIEPGAQELSQNDGCVWHPPGWQVAQFELCPTFDSVVIGTSTPPIVGTSTTPQPPWQPGSTTPPWQPGTTTPPWQPGTTTPICLQVMTRAYNPTTGDCQDFSSSCISSGWVAGECRPNQPIPPIKPGEPRECAPGEMPHQIFSAGFAGPPPPPACVMPMYRWSLNEQKWEKCDRNKLPPHVDFYNIKNKERITHTNCTSFDFELEQEWRGQRYITRDPRENGEWYEPAWDASAEMFRYNQGTDSFEPCGREAEFRTTAVRPSEYYASCKPVPEKDKVWMLLRARAEYAMHKRWSQPQPGEKPGIPFPPVPLPPPPVPEITTKQCRPYMLGIRSSLAGDRQFLKDVGNQLENAPEDYADRGRVQELLKQAAQLITSLEKTTRQTRCSAELTAQMQKDQATLHNEIFTELSLYLPEMRDHGEYQQCVVDLHRHSEYIEGLLKNGVEDEIEEELNDLRDSIDEKLEEFEANRSDFAFDVNFECGEFRADVQSILSPLQRSADKDLNRIVEEVMEKKFAPILEKLAQQLEEKGQKIEELLVKVAQVHKAIEKVSESASAISDKITVSYSALSRIEEKFGEERAEIQAAKDRLIPLVETAIRVINEEGCFQGTARETLIQEFGTVATINWLEEKAAALEKRLNLFIASCRSRNIAASDIDAFHETIETASQENMRSSYERGLTPFQDVPTHEWYYGGMLTAHREGYLTQGRPGESVLRQDALLMVLRVSGVEDNELIGECDIGAIVTDVSAYARCAVKAGLERNLSIKGAMNVPIQRGEVARWISELALVPTVSAQRIKEVKSEYGDIQGIDQAWEAPIASMVDAKVMVGVVTDSTKNWQPKDTLTRAALAVVLEQLMRVESDFQE